MKKHTPHIKTLTLNLQEGDPPTLHPHKGVDLRSRCLLLALNEPLMRRKSDGMLELAAASKVEIDPTKTIYTFHIRPHKWSNGEAVTAKHFADAWKYALDPQSCCIRADFFYSIKNAEKVKKNILPKDALKISTPDDKTLIVELEHPTPYFLDLTASSFFSPLYEISHQEPTYFSGPFVVEEWLHNQKLTFKQNPLYWDRAQIELEQICFTMVQDPMTALSMYEQGALDLVGDPFSALPFDAIHSLATSGQLETKLIPRIFYLLINTSTPPLHLKSLRKALAFSIDRNQIVQHLFFGETPSFSHLPKTLSLLDGKELEQHNHTAIALFEEALTELNVTRENFPKIVLGYANLSGQKSLVQFIQEQWEKTLGIKVEIECTEWNTHVTNLRKKNYQMGTIHLTSLYQDPMFYFELFRDKAALCNYSGWEDAHFRSLLELSEQTTDKEIRHQALSQAERHLFEEMPVIPVFTQTLQYLTRKDVDLVISDLGIYDFKRTKSKIRLNDD